MPEIALINGRFIDPSRASVSIDDWAFRYGWGLFETLRVIKECPLFLDRHIARLCSSAPLLGLGDNTRTEAKRWVHDIKLALDRSKLRNAVINCYWTRGGSPSRSSQKRVVRIRQSRKYAKRPVRLWVAPWRIEPTSPGVAAKTLAYFPYIYAGISARQEGFDEALLLNSSNCIADCAASSVFVVIKDRLHTPRLDQGTLAGVTRQVVLELARDLWIRSAECRIGWKQLRGADAIFITSALREVVPVSRVCDTWKANRSDHPMFTALRRSYDEAVANEISRWRQSR